MSEEWNNNENGSGQNGYNYNNGEQDYAFHTLMKNGRPKTIGWSVASLVVGVISLVCCCLGWSGVVLGALAVVFAILSRRMLGYFDGLSIAGMVLGIFGFVLGAALIFITYAIPEEFWEEYYKQIQDMYGSEIDGDF
jgi:hypothetical protein